MVLLNPHVPSLQWDIRNTVLKHCKQLLSFASIYFWEVLLCSFLYMYAFMIMCIYKQEYLLKETPYFDCTVLKLYLQLSMQLNVCKGSRYCSLCERDHRLTLLRLEKNNVMVCHVYHMMV